MAYVIFDCLFWLVAFLRMSTVAFTAQSLGAGELKELFVFQVEGGIRDLTVTGVQTCALPICAHPAQHGPRGGPQRHRLSMVLGIAAGAVLCGMRGYQAISDWAQSLGQKSRERFGCRREGIGRASGRERG